MKLQNLLVPLVAVQTAQASLVTRQSVAADGITEAAVADLLMNHGNLLPPNGRLMLKERLKGRLMKRQSSTMMAVLGSLAATIDHWDRKRPNAKVPVEQESDSPDWPGARRKKIRYGPYRIPPTSEINLEAKMLNAKGLTNTLAIGAAKPCTGECVVFSITPGLEYADGVVANTNNGAWLHHAVLINAGLGVQDYTCPDGLESFMEHLFESGNERTVIPYALANNTIKSGLHIRSGDSFIINTELMNMEDKEKWAWLTLTFDYLDDPPREYMEGKVIWMSVGPNRCTGTDDNVFGATNLTVTQQPTKRTFEEHSIPWQAREDGFLLGANGHLHEGGTSLKVFQNGKQICDSMPKYGKSAGGGMGGHHKTRKLRKRDDPPVLAAQKKLKPIMAPAGYTNDDIQNIVAQSFCEFHDAIPVKTGDTLWIRTDYNYDQFPGMINRKGEIDEVMGIAGTLAAFPFVDPME